MSGTYDTAVGDYDGNDYDDIAYVANGKVTTWLFNGGGYSQTIQTTGRTNTVPVAISGLGAA